MYCVTRRKTPTNGSAVVLTLAACAMISVAMAGDPVASTKTAKLPDTRADLVGSNEVPPVDTKASATSTIAISSDLTVRGDVETTGIEGTVAHIHLGALGTNGPPIITLQKSSPSVWSVPANSSLTKAQYDSYLSGDLYINVHSAAHPDGAIRLQLKP